MEPRSGRVRHLRSGPRPLGTRLHPGRARQAPGVTEPPGPRDPAVSPRVWASTAVPASAPRRKTCPSADHALFERFISAAPFGCSRQVPGPRRPKPRPPPVARDLAPPLSEPTPEVRPRVLPAESRSPNTKPRPARVFGRPRLSRTCSPAPPNPRGTAFECLRLPSIPQPEARPPLAASAPLV